VTYLLLLRLPVCVQVTYDLLAIAKLLVGAHFSTVIQDFDVVQNV